MQNKAKSKATHNDEKERIMDYKELQNLAKSYNLFNYEELGIGIINNGNHEINKISFNSYLNEVGERLLNRLCVLYDIDSKLTKGKNTLYKFLLKSETKHNLTLNDFIIRYYRFLIKRGIIEDDKISFIAECIDNISANKDLSDSGNITYDKYFFRDLMNPNVMCLLYLLNELIIDYDKNQQSTMSIIDYHLDKNKKMHNPFLKSQSGKMPLISRFITVENKEVLLLINVSSDNVCFEKYDFAKYIKNFICLLDALKFDRSTIESMTQDIDSTFTRMLDKISQNEKFNIYTVFPPTNIYKNVWDENELFENILLDSFIHIYNRNEEIRLPNNQKILSQTRDNRNGKRKISRMYAIFNKIYENRDSSSHESIWKQYEYGDKILTSKSLSNLLTALENNQFLIPLNIRSVKQKVDDKHNKMEYLISELFDVKQPFAGYEFAVHFQPLDYFNDFLLRGKTNIHPSEYTYYPVLTGNFIKKTILNQELSIMVTAQQKETKMESDNKVLDNVESMTRQEKIDYLKEYFGTFYNISDDFAENISEEEISRIISKIYELPNNLKEIIQNSYVQPDELYREITEDDRYFKKTSIYYHSDFAMIENATTVAQKWNIIFALLGNYIRQIADEYYKLLLAYDCDQIKEFCENMSDKISERLKTYWEECKKEYTNKIKDTEVTDDRVTKYKNKLCVDYFNRYFINENDNQ